MLEETKIPEEAQQDAGIEASKSELESLRNSMNDSMDLGLGSEEPETVPESSEEEKGLQTPLGDQTASEEAEEAENEEEEGALSLLDSLEGDMEEEEVEEGEEEEEGEESANVLTDAQAWIKQNLGGLKPKNLREKVAVETAKAQALEAELQEVKSTLSDKEDEWSRNQKAEQLATSEVPIMNFNETSEAKDIESKYNEDLTKTSRKLSTKAKGELLQQKSIELIKKAAAARESGTDAQDELKLEIEEDFGDDAPMVLQHLNEGRIMLEDYSDAEGKFKESSETASAEYYSKVYSERSAQVRESVPELYNLTDEERAANPNSLRAVASAWGKANPKKWKEFMEADAKIISELRYGAPPFNPKDSQWRGKTEEQARLAYHAKVKRLNDTRHQQSEDLMGLGIMAARMFPSMVGKLNKTKKKGASPKPVRKTGAPKKKVAKVHDTARDELEDLRGKLNDGIFGS